MSALHEFGRPGSGLRRRPATSVYVAGALAAVLGVITVVAGAPVAWWLLGICAVVTGTILVTGIKSRRFFEPLVFVAAISLVSFVVRPLQLFLNSKDLLSFTAAGSTLDSLLRLDNQEISLFATTKLGEALQPALTRTIGACALFLLVLALAYGLPAGARIARFAGRRGSWDDEVRATGVIAVCLVIGLVGQFAIVVKTGGLAKVADTQIDQSAQKAGLALHHAGWLLDRRACRVGHERSSQHQSESRRAGARGDRSVPGLLRRDRSPKPRVRDPARARDRRALPSGVPYGYARWWPRRRSPCCSRPPRSACAKRPMTVPSPRR